MTTKDICIVLARPEESRNIGSVCRAMANMGITKLRIIGNKNNFKDRQIRILAIHAAYIWDQAEFYSSITDAVADCTLSAGTTRRHGKKRKEWLITPEEFAVKASNNDNCKIAVVFGNERTGLTDEELNECSIGVQIPSSPDFPSLNLSHAVQIICYELYKSMMVKGFTGYTPITLNRLNDTVSLIADNLQKIGFFSIKGRPEMEQFWRSLLARAIISEGEAQYLEMIFSKAAGLSTSKTKNITTPEK